MTELFARSFRAMDEPQVPGYRILDILGQGGHAAVYRAEDEAGREVAIKRWLDPELDSGARSDREAQALAELDHPGIAGFIALTEDQTGRPCLVMERIEGRCLAAILDERGRLSPEEVLELGLALAKVLEYLAERGVVHRDIKPSNVVMRRDGAPTLVDFSIVKRRAPSRDDGRLTATGSSLGTAPYMAPEQCEGEIQGRGPIDHRTDIYGLGALLFHALTGHPPWRRETAWERLTRDPWRQPYPTVPKLRQEIQSAQRTAPPGLGKVIARCLQGEPKRRYPRPRKLRQALEKLQRPAPRRRGRARTALLALSGLVLATLILFFLFVDQGPAPRPTDRRSAQLNEKESPVKPKTTITSLAAPLLLIASGSELEAQVYEKTAVRDCPRCQQTYDARTERCPDDGQATRRRIAKVVRDVEAYFPLKSGASLAYKVRPFSAKEIGAVTARFVRGVAVKSVALGSPASKAKIEVGDRILAVDGHETADEAALRRLLRARRSGQRVELTVLSMRQTARVKVSGVLGPGAPETYLGITLVSPENQAVLKEMEGEFPAIINAIVNLLEFRLQVGEPLSREPDPLHPVDFCFTDSDAKERWFLRWTPRGLRHRRDKDGPEALAVPFPLEADRSWTTRAPLNLLDREGSELRVKVVGFTRLTVGAEPCLTLETTRKVSGASARTLLYYRRELGLVRAVRTWNGVATVLELEAPPKTIVVPLLWTAPTAEQILREGRERDLKGKAIFYVYVHVGGVGKDAWVRHKFREIEGGLPEPALIGDKKGEPRKVQGRDEPVNFYTGAVLLDCGPEEKELGDNTKKRGCFMVIRHADGRVERISSFDRPEQLAAPQLRVKHAAPILTEVAAQRGQIAVRWRADSAKNAYIVIERYEVLRRSAGGSFQVIAKLPFEAKEHLDRGVEVGVEYAYKIRSIARLNGLDPVVARARLRLPASERVRESEASSPVRSLR